MIKEKVAVRYGRAIFEIAKEQDSIISYGECLTVIAKGIEGNSELEEYLSSPHVPRNAKKELLGEVFSGAPEMVKNFLFLLIDKGREMLLKDIAFTYQEIVDEEFSSLEVAVVSAKPLKEENQILLTQKLEEISGKSIRLRLSEDPSLIGGMILHVGNRWIDGSLKGQLESLKYSLMKPTQKQMEVEA